MDFIWNQYVLIGALNALLALLVAIACWQYRSVPATKPLIGMMISVGFWALLASLEMGTVPTNQKIFWNTLLYIPLFLAPTFYVVFALSYTGKGQLLGPRLYILLALIPSLVFIATATNSFHHLHWTSFTRSENNILIYGHGPIFWVGLIGYTYALFLMASLLLLRVAIQFPKGYRMQALLVTFSSAIPFTGSLFYIFNISPWPGLDITPLCLAGSGAFLGLGVMRLNLLDLIPVARATLIEKMPDGLVVFDDRKRVLDINAAAAQLMGSTLRHINDLPPAWSELVALLESPHQEFAEIFVSTRLILEARITPLPIPGHTGRAHIVILRDITRVKQAENALREANERLRELTVRDELTGLYNRRFLMDALPRELARARREKVALAIAMMDIDHFKQFNDQHGHQAGDTMLQGLGLFLRARIRQEDLACRYGGEEFVLILTGADENIALMRAESIRREFAEFGVTWKTQTLRATLSIGVACYPDQASDEVHLLNYADKALYAAKANGRNRCMRASLLPLQPTAAQEILTS